MTSTLIYNAHLWSAGEQLPGDSILIDGGRIAAIGDEPSILAEHPSPESRVDAEGGLVHPSFADSHVHAAFSGIERGRCDLSSADSADDALSIVRRFVESCDRSWVLGSGWQMPHFPGGTPRKEDLDRITTTLPVFLSNADHHSYWVNSKALELAGISASTPDPDDGRLERDEHGEPTGTLHEGASALVAAHVPVTEDEEVARGILDSAEVLLGYGVTAWQDPLVGEFGEYPDISSGYREAIRTEDWHARANGALWVPRDITLDTLDALIEDFCERRTRNRTAGFPTDTAKIMLDGTAENATALLEHNYCGHDHAGLGYFDPDLINAVVAALNHAGFAVHFHAIGDRAVSIALDAVEAVPPTARTRNHIAHVQLINPRDVPRFAELGVTVNAQALWACNEAQMTELTVHLLGSTRTHWQYPFGSLQRFGASLAMGSDWPVSTPDPWQAIHVAVTRQPPGQPQTPALNDEESISLSDALDAYTRGSHRLIGFPDAGELTVGKRADLVVADRDPFEASATDIHLTRVRRVYSNGTEVRLR